METGCQMLKGCKEKQKPNPTAMPPFSPTTKSTKIKQRRTPNPTFIEMQQPCFWGRNISLTVVGQAKLCTSLDRIVAVRQIISFFPSRATPWRPGNGLLEVSVLKSCIHRLSQIHCALFAFCFQKACEITCSVDKNLPAG